MNLGALKSGIAQGDPFESICLSLSRVTCRADSIKSVRSVSLISKLKVVTFGGIGRAITLLRLCHPLSRTRTSDVGGDESVQNLS